MLCISRKQDESITLHLPNGEVATIVLTKISGSRATFGIQADRQIRITRSGFASDTVSQTGYDAPVKPKRSNNSLGRNNHVRT